MEIKINNNDKLFLIAAIIGFIAFFLPWVGGGFIGQHSGYDLITYGNQMGGDAMYLLLLPASFLLVALAKLQIIKINPAFLKLIELVPIASITFALIQLFDALGIRMEYLGEMDGAVFEIFKIGFPLTLISSIIIIFSPIAKQVTISQNEKDKSDSSEKIDYHKTGEELGKKVASTGVKLSSDLKTLFKWLKANPKVLYLLGITAVALVAVWLVFVKEYPKRDAKKLAGELCECYANYEKEIEEGYTEYLQTFETQNFLKRRDAKSVLNSIRNPINTRRYDCVEIINSKYENLKNKFDYKNRNKFELAYLENQNNCSNTNKSEIATLNFEIEKKIETIKDPEPDIHKIKEDLIGQKTPGWNFDYLSEFQEAKILNKTKGKNIIEYKIYFKLHSERSDSEHDCEIMAVYKQGYDGWNFDKLNMNYITYTNTFYPDKWTRITPIRNHRWNAENNYKMAWKTSSWSYAKEIITGPGLGAKTLPNSNSYYIKSLENKEIKVKFTYRPN